MYCQVCGDPNGTKYCPSKRQRLCPSCAKRTPRKVRREVFDRVYWESAPGKPPESTRREFYEDYLRSDLNLHDYIDHTVGVY